MKEVRFIYEDDGCVDVAYYSLHLLLEGSTCSREISSRSIIDIYNWCVSIRVFFKIGGMKFINGDIL